MTFQANRLPLLVGISEFPPNYFLEEFSEIN